MNLDIITEYLSGNSEIPKNPKKRKEIIDQITNEMMKARLVCRRTDKYSEAQEIIIDKAFKELYTRIDNSLYKNIGSHSNGIDLKKIISKIVSDVFISILKDSFLLNNLVNEIKKDKIYTREKRYKIEDFSAYINLFRGHLGPRYTSWRKLNYEYFKLIYNQAFNDAVLFICDSSKNINFEKSFLNYFSGIIRNKMIDIYKDERKSGLTKAPKDFNTNIIRFGYFNSYLEDNLVHKESFKKTFYQEKFIPCLRLIQNDPTGIYRKTHMQNRPDINFKSVLQMRLNGQTFSEISQEFDVQERGLTLAFKRWMNKFKSDFSIFIE